MSYISLTGRYVKSPCGGNTYLSATVYVDKRQAHHKYLNVGVYTKNEIYNEIMNLKRKYNVDEIIMVKQRKPNPTIEFVQPYIDLFI